MGVLPLEFMKNESIETLKLKGDELFTISNLDKIRPQQKIAMLIQRSNGEIFSINLNLRIDTAHRDRILSKWWYSTLCFRRNYKLNYQKNFKLLSEKGLCSRREADELIQLGLVKVNGRVAKIGEKCSYDSILTIDKKPLKHTIILNKPLGFVSSQPEKNYKPAITLITKNNYHGNNKNLNLDKFFLKN